MKRLGIDIGSTTIKCAVISETGELLYSSYERHKSRIAEKMSALLENITQKFNGEKMLLGISGSAGMGVANDLKLPFIQEVYATRLAVQKFLPETDTVIELGGEDAKILFLSDTLEVRMNGTCAGGTGAFIDQMAELMSISAEEMQSLACESEKIYTIASRCGVFAKTDIQPLLNQGARKEDVSASIFYAVVNQTIAGLAQGREIEGNVLYLGGPLTFFPYLRSAFDDVLKVKGICPDNSLYFVAIGAGISPTAAETDLRQLKEITANYKSQQGYPSCRPIFASEEEYGDFLKRHAGDSGNIREISAPQGKMFLGIDAGSTTVKAVLIDEEGNIFYPMYKPNCGNPVDLVREYLGSLYEKFPDIEIASSAVTGYGEEIIKNAFSIDLGVVETIAHYTSAKFFCPEVDFIVDIGGQDIKCFKIRGGAIDSIFLNEACSSGCGSFLQTFAGVLGFTAEEFARKALFADKPVDLGSRCTVFMNSSVKQAQKDGASLENISAGLSISVVKNALYKVIRQSNPALLGEHIVVQGGTFLNNAVLRAFEQEIGRDVLRPAVAGLMGAYGAALYAKENCGRKSSIAGAKEIAEFEHKAQAVTCNGCSNHCRLTINTFTNGRKFIAGNRCEKPLAKPKTGGHCDLYEYKYNLLKRYRENVIEPGRRTVGIPMGLNMYELLPFWFRLFRELGFNVLVSGESTHDLYVRGQHTIASDTICYPAKLLHGHMEDLFEKKPDFIFYPSMSYNLDEGLGKNHYNCPIVAYYPEVIRANVHFPPEIKYIHGFVALHDRQKFVRHFTKMMRENGVELREKDVRHASSLAYAEYENFVRDVRAKAREFITFARSHSLQIIVLAGRPYHIDPEINHGINRLICDFGAVVITEDSISNEVAPFETTVLNQWTFHSRLYSAAKYVAEHPELNMNLIQLVSFGCGVDAVTSDETRAILEARGKLYTQIKIDEITNLGAVKIRLRSLLTVAQDKTGRGKRK